MALFISLVWYVLIGQNYGMGVYTRLVTHSPTSFVNIPPLVVQTHSHLQYNVLTEWVNIFAIIYTVSITTIYHVYNQHLFMIMILHHIHNALCHSSVRNKLRTLINVRHAELSPFLI